MPSAIEPEQDSEKLEELREAYGKAERIIEAQTVTIKALRESLRASYAFYGTIGLVVGFSLGFQC